ncbi:MAG: CHAT domain-containing protein [Calditrichae bacterium]|nr:CHAT domain-containing protein [Calditrichia bacterium]
MNLKHQRSIFVTLTLLFLGFSAAYSQTDAGKSFIHFRMLKVSTENQANEIIERYAAGESFQKLARKFSEHSTANLGGDLPWQPSESIPQVFLAVLNKLEINAISEPIALQNGYFLLQKVDELNAYDYSVLQQKIDKLNGLLNEIEIGFAKENGNLTALLAQATALNSEVKDDHKSLKIFNMKGLAAATSGDMSTADDAFSAMLALADNIGDDRTKASALRNLGQVKKNSGDFEAAISYYDSALAVAKAIGDVETVEISLGMLGQIYESQQQFPKAIGYFTEAIAMPRNPADQQLKHIWFGNLGQMYRQLGDYSRSLAYLDSAINNSQTAGNTSAMADFIAAKAQVLLAKGDARPALGLLNQSLALARVAGNKFAEGMRLGNLGQAYKTLGKLDSARTLLDDAQMIAQSTQQTDDDGLWLGSLGQVFNAMGNYTSAIENYEKALAIARQNGDRSNEAVWLGSIGQVYETTGDYQRALSYLDSAATITRETGDLSSQLFQLGNLGEFYFSNEKYDDALKTYTDALAIARKLGAKSQEQIRLGSIGQVWQQQSQPEKAIVYYDSAIAIAREIGDEYNTGIWLGSKGLVLRSLKNYDAAIDHFNQSLEIAQSINDKESIWRQYWNLAATYANIDGAPKFQVVGMFDNAVNSLKEIAGDLVNFSQKRNYLEVQNKQALYDDFIAYLMRQPEARYHEKALEISEASRNRALKDLLQGQQLEAQLSIEKRQAATERTEELFTKVQEPMMASTDSPNNRFRSAETDLLEKWATGIAIPSRNIGSSEGAPDLGLREIKNEARERQETLLMYHILPGGVAMWVIQPNGKMFATVQNIPADSLFRLVSATRNHLGISDGLSRGAEVLQTSAGGGKKYQQTLRELDELLIQPVAEYLPKSPDESLMIIPHDILYVFPFACLVDAQNKYLVERNVFATAPSVGLLKFTRARVREQFNRERPWLLLMGNPEMPDPAIWSQLYGAEREVEMIAKRVNESGGAGLQESGAQSLKALSLIGDNASEAEFRRIAGVQNYLHFATHGYQVRDPMRCGLVLAKTGETVETNGILTTSEIFGLPLNAELVVLSACETGLGHISSDGLAGLSMSFLYAGTSSLMVSLWKVPDEATQYLMVKFYEELATDGNKSRSLQTAQLHTMAKYPHPRDWAAFSLIGQN